MVPQHPRVDGTSEGLWSPARRGLTVGLVLSTTLIAAEALAVITIMPRVARRRLPLHELDGADSAAAEAVAGVV
ncbi:MAG: hypothetical protein ABSB69_03140 [Solirubrobacteraceae bacterium]